jgi:hypothetical protein
MSSSRVFSRLECRFLRTVWLWAAASLAVWGLAAMLPASQLAAQEEDPPAKAEKGEEQEKSEKTESTETPPKKKPGKDEDKIQEPEDLTLTTGDGVKLAITYYPGRKGKESIPVILLHDWKGGRKDFTQEGGLAPALQKLGCAVVVPDLRGHGDTKMGPAGKAAAGKTAKSSTGAKDVLMMVPQDLGAVKDFLWKKNNAQELNINKTCVVGAELGASLAMGYALYDSVGYEQGRPYYGTVQLGQFVKAMVLISPEYTFKGLNASAVAHNDYVRSKPAVMILVGKENTKALAEAKRVHGLFDKNHPAPDTKDPQKSQTLLYGRLPTSLQGMKIVDEKDMNVAQIIGQFIARRLVDAPEAKKWAWKVVKLPHEQE